MEKLYAGLKALKRIHLERTNAMAKKYTTKAGGKNAGYTKLKGGKIRSKKTGRTYSGKGATLKARKRRAMFSHMNK